MGVHKHWRIGVAVASMAGLAWGEPCSRDELIGGLSLVFTAGSGDGPTVPSDLDGDGLVDLVQQDLFADGLPSTPSSGVVVTFNNSSGAGLQFAEPIYVETIAYPEQFVAADVTGDGLGDIVAIDRSSTWVGVSRGLAGRAFAPPVYFEVPGAHRVRAVGAVDLNNDGTKTAVIVSESLAGNAQVFALVSDLGFLPVLINQFEPFVAEDEFGLQDALFADFTGDGIDDLALLTDGVSFALDGSYHYRVEFRIQAADGVSGFGGTELFTPVGWVQTYWYPNRDGYLVNSQDVDNDGDADLGLVSWGAATYGWIPLGEVVLVNAGSGQFSFVDAYTFGADNINNGVTGDFDCDGALDLADVRDFESFSLLFGRGGYPLPQADRRWRHLPPGATNSVVLADVDGDLRSDWIVPNLYYGDVTVILNGSGPISSGCAADLAQPFGVLDLQDIVAFVQAFSTQSQIADFEPDGVFDLADIVAFVSAFGAGCT